MAKLLRRHRTSGSAAALPRGHGPALRLDAPALAQLTACLRQSPDATLDQLATWLAAVGGPSASRSALARAVQGLGWRQKNEPPRRRTLH